MHGSAAPRTHGKGVRAHLKLGNRGLLYGITNPPQYVAHQVTSKQTDEGDAREQGNKDFHRRTPRLPVEVGKRQALGLFSDGKNQSASSTITIALVTTCATINSDAIRWHASRASDVVDEARSLRIQTCRHSILYSYWYHFVTPRRTSRSACRHYIVTANDRVQYPGSDYAASYPSTKSSSYRSIVALIC